MVLWLPRFIFSRVADKILDVELTFRSSMWCDVSQGKLIEIETINGAILKYVELLDIDCPTSKKSAF